MVVFHRGAIYDRVRNPQHCTMVGCEFGNFRWKYFRKFIWILYVALWNLEKWVLWHCWFGHITWKNHPRYDDNESINLEKHKLQSEIHAAHTTAVTAMKCLPSQRGMRSKITGETREL